MNELARTWHDDVATQILAEPIGLEYIERPVKLERLQYFLNDRNKYQQKMATWDRRSNQICQVVPGLACLLGASFVVLIIAAIASAPSLIIDLASGGILVSLNLTIVLLIVMTVLESRALNNPGLYMEKVRDRYLPSLVHDQQKDMLVIGLQHINDDDWYSQRTFAPSETTAALEYQVELEEIIQQVSERKQEQFVHALQTTQTSSGTQGQITSDQQEQLQLFAPQPNVINSATRELIATVEEQARPTRVLLNP